MVKGRPDPNWKEKVLEWQASGKSGKTWCIENAIPYSTLCGWNKRLRDVQDPSAIGGKRFIELKEIPYSETGIVLEYQGVKIHLKAGFDLKTLEECLRCVGDLRC